MSTYVRFESGAEDRFSPDYGPFDFVQMTYGELWTPDNAELLGYLDKQGYWNTSDEQLWSDVVIYHSEHGSDSERAAIAKAKGVQP